MGMASSMVEGTTSVKSAGREGNKYARARDTAVA
jgi:hypothetical protein